eukprot:1162149-Pelagomonas_calceolata.AAC.7
MQHLALKTDDIITTLTGVQIVSRSNGQPCMRCQEGLSEPWNHLPLTLTGRCGSAARTEALTSCPGLQTSTTGICQGRQQSCNLTSHGRQLSTDRERGRTGRH